MAFFFTNDINSFDDQCHCLQRRCMDEQVLKKSYRGTTRPEWANNENMSEASHEQSYQN